MLRETRDAARASKEVYTPRAVVRLMVAVTGPRTGETVLDPACATGSEATWTLSTGSLDPAAAGKPVRSVASNRSVCSPGSRFCKGAVGVGHQRRELRRRQHSRPYGLPVKGRVLAQSLKR